MLDAAEAVFGREGYHKAAIFDITRTAGVGQGTFYLYFPSKEALFEELVNNLGHEMRRRLHQVVAAAPDRAGAERYGFDAYFKFTAEHPAMYRIVREAEFVAPAAYREWYRRLGERYVERIKEAMKAGEYRRLDPEVVAYCMMAMGDFLGMRMVLWEGRQKVSARDLDTMMEVILRGVLGADPR